MRPDEDLAGARAATERLLEHLGSLTPPQLTAPSLLPGWSAAHVVAHLAGNAWSHVRMLDGCLQGEVRDQYENAQSRADGIQQLAARPEAVVQAHADAADALEQRWAALDDGQLWERPVRWLDRGTAPAHTTVWSRWKEVEVHRLDLAAGYSPDDWPADFVQRLLGRLLARTDLPPMTLVIDGAPTAVAAGAPRVSGTGAALAAWLAGRSTGADLAVEGGSLPALPPWR